MTDSTDCAQQQRPRRPMGAMIIDIGDTHVVAQDQYGNLASFPRHDAVSLARAILGWYDLPK